MDTSKRPGQQQGSPVFVKWDAHWYRVPNTLAHNMIKAGLTICAERSEATQFPDAGKSKL